MVMLALLLIMRDDLLAHNSCVVVPLQNRKEPSVAYDELAHGISDQRQNLRANRRDAAYAIGQEVRGADSNVTLPDDLTKLVADLAEIDPNAFSMSTAEYAYSLLLAYHVDLIEQRYIGIDADEHERVVFVIQPAR